MKFPRTVVVQRMLMHYRIPFIKRLEETVEGNLCVITSRRPYSGAKAPVAPVPHGIAHKSVNISSMSVHVGKKRYFVIWQHGIIKTTRKCQPDVLLCEGESNIITNMRLIPWAIRNKVPYVWWSLGKIIPEDDNLMRRISWKPLQWMLQHAGAIVTYSTRGKRYYMEKYGISEGKIFVALNCLDDVAILENSRRFPHACENVRRETNIGSKDRVLLYVGALTKSKQPDLFMDICRELRLKYPELRGIMVGDGPMREVLEPLSEAAGVSMVGRKVDDVERYFLASDIYVMPGLGGLGIHQAMTLGLPVISAPADGTPEDLIIDGENGYIIREQKVGAWTQPISAMLENPLRLMAAGAKSREIVQDYANMRNMIAQYKSAIRYASRTAV